MEITIVSLDRDRSFLVPVAREDRRGHERQDVNLRFRVPTAKSPGDV